MNILRVLIIWLIPLSVFAEIPLEYKKIINKYKAHKIHSLLCKESNK